MHDPRPSKADLHVHSKHSDRPSEWFLRRIGSPESFCRAAGDLPRAQQRGMDFVTISDHNCIRGALEIAHLPGHVPLQRDHHLLSRGRLQGPRAGARHRRGAVPHDPGAAGRHLRTCTATLSTRTHRVGDASAVPGQRPADHRPRREAAADVPSLRGDQRRAGPAAQRN